MRECDAQNAEEFWLWCETSGRRRRDQRISWKTGAVAVELKKCRAKPRAEESARKGTVNWGMEVSDKMFICRREVKAESGSGSRRSLGMGDRWDCDSCK